MSSTSIQNADKGSTSDSDLISSRIFPPLKNDRILCAAKGQKVDKIPVWIMRQAGRYLPEFRELRKMYSFFEICETPSLACEATLMPLKHFELDAAIIFSDILVIPKALGMEVVMGPNGPTLPQPLEIDDVQNLSSTKEALKRLIHVGEAIALTRHKLDGSVPLYGFSGAPWTLMAYMIEGGGSKTQSKAKKWLYAHPEASNQLLSLLTDTIIDYLVMQVEYGAQILQIFDSSAEYLNKKLYLQFCIPYLQKIRVKVQEKLIISNLNQVPMVLFAKGASFCLEEQTKLGYEVLQIDWTVNPEDVKSSTFKNITIQGNLDPCALYAPKNELEKLADEMVRTFGPTHYIANLGHGIYPDMDMQAVETFVNAVHNVNF